MRLTLFAITSLAVAWCFVVWTPLSIRARARPSHPITFSTAGVSLALESGWERKDLPSEHSACPPMLVNQADTIRVVLLPPDLSDPQSAAAGLRTSFAANPKGVKDSFRQEAFVTEGGLDGLHVSFRQQPEKADRGCETESHHYIVRNQRGHCVAVHYLAAAPQHAVAVDQMIRAGLSLQ